MTKKNIGKVAWNVTKAGVSLGVGVGTVIVTEAICTAYAPAEAASTVMKVAYKVGTRGVSMVTGAVAADLAKQELDTVESRMVTILSKKSETKQIEEVKAA